MSAFIVSNETMQRAVDALYAEHGEAPQPTMIGNVSIRTTDDADDMSRLGCALFQMNVEAVDDRYDETNALPFFRWTVTMAGNQCAGLKALRCLIYQCTEGDMPDTKMYQDLKRVADEIAYSIVRSMPEYERAVWD